MVHSFLIHTLGPVSALSANESRVLFARAFGPEESAQRGAEPEPEPELVPETRRLLQKERLAVVARRVRSVVALGRAASGVPAVECVLGEEAAALGEADVGVLRLTSGEPFAVERTVLWLAVQSLAFCLVCDMHENLLLAEGTLRNIGRRCLEELRLLGPGSEVILKSDRIDALLNHYLPHGQLLFLNHRFTHCLDRELSSYGNK
ncbi:AP-5 complex subunit sigma-1 [Denticeps clupeoides]|uniref:AP-5 complex subunit sigma-1 n=1 Tax=Denticeps clupeoides TaxID=299321 RepID=A0AAY4ESM8_9TELE|nr:AP-5 complex subunit sigma-1 [Denticeps clupeoides]